MLRISSILAVQFGRVESHDPLSVHVMMLFPVRKNPLLHLISKKLPYVYPGCPTTLRRITPFATSSLSKEGHSFAKYLKHKVNYTLPKWFKLSLQYGWTVVAVCFFMETNNRLPG